MITMLLARAEVGPTSRLKAIYEKVAHVGPAPSQSHCTSFWIFLLFFQGRRQGWNPDISFGKDLEFEGRGSVRLVCNGNYGSVHGRLYCTTATTDIEVKNIILTSKPTDASNRYYTF